MKNWEKNNWGKDQINQKKGNWDSYTSQTPKNNNRGRKVLRNRDREEKKVIKEIIRGKRAVEIGRKRTRVRYLRQREEEKGRDREVKDEKIDEEKYKKRIKKKQKHK